MEKLGKPRYWHQNKKWPKYLSIWLLKHKVGGYRIKTELHFHKDFLFYFNHTFTNLFEKDKKNVFKILKQKYFENTHDCTKYKAEDSKQNQVFITNNLNLSVHYLNHKKRIIDELHAIINNTEKRTKIKQMKEKELFDKL